MAGGNRRKSEWGLALAILCLCLALAGTAPVARLEGLLPGWAQRMAPPTAEPARVTVVAVDGVTDSDTLARLMRGLEPARSVGLVPPLPTNLVTGHSPLLRGVPWLAHSARPLRPLPSHMLHWPALELPLLWRFPSLLTGRPPALARLERGGDGAAAPLDFPRSGAEGATRLPLIHRYDGQWLPGFALQLAARASHQPLAAAMLEGGHIRLGGTRLSTDHAWRLYPQLLRLKPAVIPAGEVLAGRADLRGRVVLLGLTDADAAEPVRLADGTALPPVTAEARLVAALLDGAVYTIPSWSLWARLGVLLLFTLLLALLLPRLRPTTALVLVLLCLFVTLTAEFGLLTLRATFVPLLLPSLALAVGSLLLMVRGRWRGRVERMVSELGAANLLLGQAYQSQGQLDAAFERYRRSGAVDEALAERLYSLGLDFERRRQFGKAAGVLEHLRAALPGFRDVEERLQRIREADSRALLGGGGSTTASGTVILENAGLARPMLGRYELERELGRGAMGLVYLGRDPKISRTVAIKTMALSREFDGEALEQVRERFFREAETAGRLNHPNIVTIYDVGEDDDLAYIAMDYLKGESLAAYSRADNLLPPEEVLAVGISVAEALDYAHEQGVVHRDIKPANIIYDRASGGVKVTDFGVACLTDTSKTRTGTVLGSPSYMSPEQVAGRKVDGRADLFSLGVTLYQLLSGELPFKGDSLATLMYQITHERPADIRSLREALPPTLSRFINKALHKDPERRYQRGTTMAEAMRRCQQAIREVSA